MVKVEAPLFSTDARGSLCKTIIYSKRKYKNYVKKSAPVRPKETPELKEGRTRMRRAVAIWHVLTPEVKKYWDDWAKIYTPNWSGYNAYVHFCLIALKAGQLAPMYPPD